MATDPVLGTRQDARVGELKVTRGEGGELHQTAEGKTPILTTAQGIPVADDQNSLRVGQRWADAAGGLPLSREDLPLRP